MAGDYCKQSTHVDAVRALRCAPPARVSVQAAVCGSKHCAQHGISAGKPHFTKSTPCRSAKQTPP
eukprot:140458-Pelagomonas_calceolata.AAC.6